MLNIRGMFLLLHFIIKYVDDIVSILFILYLSRLIVSSLNLRLQTESIRDVGLYLVVKTFV